MKLRTKLRLWWHRLFVRRDEFHPSLDLDLEAMWDMTPEELEVYIADVYRRRWIAHERDVARRNDSGKAP